MKIYLDDIRVAPRGWTRTYRPDETIRALETGEVTHLSLDYDLGNECPGDGHDVLCWLEEAVTKRGFKMPITTVHSGDPVGRPKMIQVIDRIDSFTAQQCQ